MTKNGKWARKNLLLDYSENHGTKTKVLNNVDCKKYTNTIFAYIEKGIFVITTEIFVTYDLVDSIKFYTCTDDI